MTDKEIKLGEEIITLSAFDASAIRLILSGESTIDWPWLEFTSREEIENFIQTQEFNLEIREDAEHLQRLHQEAIFYLTDVLAYRIPDEVKATVDLRELLMMASESSHQRKTRTYACMMLKVMHILHHLLARELLFNISLSEAQLAELLSKKVYDGIDQMRAKGIPIVEYTGGRKTRHSLVTKLLAKRETIASQIFDKTRFRIVVKSKKDLLPTVIFMNRHLFPFNYIVPGQSENNLLDLEADTAELKMSLETRRILLDKMQPLPHPTNEFSGDSYRSINFVADIPIHVGQYLKGFNPPIDPQLGQIIFILAEFQLVDEQTATNNDLGDNNHTRYKSRQEEKVRMRLEAANPNHVDS